MTGCGCGWFGAGVRECVYLWLGVVGVRDNGQKLSLERTQTAEGAAMECGPLKMALVCITWLV